MKTTIKQIGNYVVSYDGRSVVTVTRREVSERDFDDCYLEAYNLATSFPRSRCGSTWGCDGIGYHAQLRIGVVQVHNSGVGPRKYAQHIRSLTAPLAQKAQV